MSEETKKPRLILGAKKYRGKNQKEIDDYERRREQTQKVEDYLNKIRTEERQSLTAREIADAIGMEEEDVSGVLFYNRGSEAITF